jgi:hypothetical protein
MGVAPHQPVAVDPGDRRVQYTRLALPDVLDNPAFAFAYELWRSKRGARSLPARADFDPFELKPILPRVLLIEVINDPPDFRYRLAGTLARALTGEELTGRRVLDLVPVQHGRLLWNNLCEMQADRQPQYVLLNIISANGEPLSYRVLRLPLGADGETMDMVMVVQDHGDALPLLRKYFDGLRGG